MKCRLNVFKICKDSVQFYINFLETKSKHKVAGVRKHAQDLKKDEDIKCHKRIGTVNMVNDNTEEGILLKEGKLNFIGNFSVSFAFCIKSTR